MNQNNLILTGFDRSGTSAISRTLAVHPSIELVFRPFNGGSIRQKMYEVLSSDNASSSDIKFFTELEAGRFDSEYVVSWWHEKFSTIKDDFCEGQLHLLITNLNHFTVPWISTHFPSVENWAIWRDPLDVVQSCVENNFLGDWYEDALDSVKKTVQADDYLREKFERFESQLDDNVKKTGYLLAVRNTFLFNSIQPGKIVDYDLFKIDPNAALRPLLQYFELDSEFDFTKMLQQDLNSVPGTVKYTPGRRKKHTFSRGQMEFLDGVLEPLNRVIETRRICQ